MNLKAHNQRKHFRRRVAERLDIEISEKDINRLTDDILNSRYMQVEKVTCRLNMYTVNLSNIKCKVVFDKTRKTPVTVITEEMEKIGKEKNKTLKQYMETIT